MINRLVCFSAAAALVLTLIPGGDAHAEEPEATKAAEGSTPAESVPEQKASNPILVTPIRDERTDYNSRPLTPRAGGTAVRVDLDVNLTKNAEAEPVNVSGAAYFGVNDTLAIGVTTNVHGEIWGYGNGAGAPNGLCLGGEDRGCPKLFNNVALDALLGFIRQPGTDAALRTGVDLVSIVDPSAVAVHVGFFARFTGGPLAVLVDPSVQIGITKRDAGNKEVIYLPIRLGFQTTPDLNVGLVTGLAGPIDGFSDRYTIPIGVSGLFALGSRVDVGAVVAFPNAFGKDSSTDVRTFGLVGHFRF
jgi:hypothetical protein